jgi:hypothetical protein
VQRQYALERHEIRAVNDSPLSQSIDILETARLFGRLASRWRCDGSRDSR